MPLPDGLTAAIAAVEAQATALSNRYDAAQAAAVTLTDDLEAAEQRAMIAEAKLARARLRPGIDVAGPDNTGTIPGEPRTNWNAPGTVGKVAVAPGTYDTQDFYGDCYPADPAGTYLFRGCRFHGGVGHPSGNRGCFYCWNLTTGWATFEDCTFAPDSPSYYRDGIVGHRYTASRCQSFGGTDGFGVNGNGGAIIEWPYVPWLTWFKQDPAHTDGTHNDPVAIQGGGPNVVRDGNLACYVKVADTSTGPNTRPAPNGMFYGGSAIIVNQAKSLDVIHDTTISGNLLSGGYAQLQLNNNRGTGYVLAVTLGPNQYDRDVYNNSRAAVDKRWICLVPNGGAITANMAEQRWADDGTALTPGLATGIRTV
ncbi:MAG: hypothetical protein CVT65_03910 [Actinobacteria bacterium HGW-Actinobacteria-5]|nr:MAG: hypothetical protein CVT65_03910 [Actinobacteria bacterium HGW-Actinobacteria-5]